MMTANKSIEEKQKGIKRRGLSRKYENRVTAVAGFDATKAGAAVVHSLFRIVFTQTKRHIRLGGQQEQIVEEMFK